MDISYLSQNAARSRDARNNMRRDGFTPMGYRLWTDQDDTIIRSLYPDYAAIQKKFPQRTRQALHWRCSFLGLTKGYHSWMAFEITKLRRLYPTASRFRLYEEFPGLSWRAIEQAAVRNGIYRAAKKYKRTGFKLIDDILSRVEEIGWTLGDLDKESRTGTYFRRHSWRHCPANFTKLNRAVTALDGSLQVVWK